MQTAQSARRLRRWALAPLAALIPLAAAPAEATVVQNVLTVIETPNGGETDDGDRIEGLTGADIDRDLLATSALGGHQARASAGRFGAVGLEVLSFQAGVAIARADIEATFVNDTGRPASAVSQFIVDGGALTLLAAAGAQAELGIFVLARTGPASGDIYNARVEVQAIQDFGGVVINQVKDDVIPTAPDPDAALPTIIVPPFVQTLDLGRIGAGAEITVTYGAVAVIDAPNQDVEVGQVTFSDPFSIRLAPPTFTPLAAVPLPAPAAALAAALALLAALARRRRVDAPETGAMAGAT